MLWLIQLMLAFAILLYLVNDVRISALSYKFVTVGKQDVDNISPFLCCEVKVMLLFPHAKITSALTVSVTVSRRAFILPTHNMGLSAFR